MNLDVTCRDIVVSRMVDIILKSIIISLSILVLASAAVVSINAKSGGSQGTKWADYTDPYGRYSIKYPSKWRIQSEPVHSDGNYLLEVPLKVQNSRGSSFTLVEAEKNTDLTLRKYTSWYQQSTDLGLTTRVDVPVSCGYISPAQSVYTCEYGQIDSIGFNEIAQRVWIFEAPQNKVFVLTLVYGPDEHMGESNISFMLGSFKLLQKNNLVAPTTSSSNNIISSCEVPYGNTTLTYGICPY